MFDTLKYAKILIGSGFTKEQAETSIEVMRDIMESNLATKEDIKDLYNAIGVLEHRLVVRLGAMSAAAVVTLGALMTLFKFL